MEQNARNKKNSKCKHNAWAFRTNAKHISKHPECCVLPRWCVDDCNWGSVLDLATLHVLQKMFVKQSYAHTMDNKHTAKSNAMDAAVCNAPQYTATVIAICAATKHTYSHTKIAWFWYSKHTYGIRVFVFVFMFVFVYGCSSENENHRKRCKAKPCNWIENCKIGQWKQTLFQPHDCWIQKKRFQHNRMHHEKKTNRSVQKNECM